MDGNEGLFGKENPEKVPSLQRRGTGSALWVWLAVMSGGIYSPQDLSPCRQILNPFFPESPSSVHTRGLVC